MMGLLFWRLFMESVDDGVDLTVAAAKGAASSPLAQQASSGGLPTTLGTGLVESGDDGFCQRAISNQECFMKRIIMTVR
jgi:hypothetical protein